jgi:hypothetical protein
MQVTWALGAILYEINALPWQFNDKAKDLPWGVIFLSSCIGNKLSPDIVTS